MTPRTRHLRFQSGLWSLTIIALLWSQWVLASHGGCLPSYPDGQTAPTATQGTHCDEAAPDTDKSLCKLHCGRADLQSDTAPTLSVPPLAVDWRIEWSVPALTRSYAICAFDRGPLPSLHGPTAHPASVLLI
jgi:hypothetical protein